MRCGEESMAATTPFYFLANARKKDFVWQCAIGTATPHHRLKIRFARNRPPARFVEAGAVLAWRKSADSGLFSTSMTWANFGERSTAEISAFSGVEDREFSNWRTDLAGIFNHIDIGKFRQTCSHSAYFIPPFPSQVAHVEEHERVAGIEPAFRSRMFIDVFLCCRSTTCTFPNIAEYNKLFPLLFPLFRCPRFFVAQILRSGLPLTRVQMAQD